MTFDGGITEQLWAAHPLPPVPPSGFHYFLVAAMTNFKKKKKKSIFHALKTQNMPMRSVHDFASYLRPFKNEAGSNEVKPYGDHEWIIHGSPRHRKRQPAMHPGNGCLM